jgi:hypothetical protein
MGGTGPGRGVAALTASRAATPGYRGAMGFNPFREQVQRKSDVLLVVAAFVVVAALVAWAFFGG